MNKKKKLYKIKHLCKIHYLQKYIIHLKLKMK